MAVGTAKSLASVGCYDLVEKIAEGGMGTVYKARHQEDGRLVAIKILSPHMAKTPILVKRFAQEYNAARAINHENIVQALEFGHQGESPYLVMEFVDGESLGQRLSRVKRIPENDAIRIIAQVARGLHRAHKLGMIHRDVKPDNILLAPPTPDHPEGTVKLADLGLVKELETDLNLTRTGRGLGTPHFMAPEQFRNAKNASVRCDIYSLAATLYMMVTGDLPFNAERPLEVWMKKVNNELIPPRQLTPGLSERVDWAIRRAMSQDPEKRPGTCREFVEDLTGHSTRKLSPPPGEVQADVWYLAYSDEDEVRHTVKGTKDGIRRSLKERLLGDPGHVRAGRSKSGPFEPLATYPEFRDLVVEPELPSVNGVKTAPVKTEAVTPVEAKTPIPPPRQPVARKLPHPDSTATSDSFAPLMRKLPPFEPAAAAPPRQAARAQAPHIDMGLSTRRIDWLKWGVLLTVAAISGIAGYYLMH
jgi:eukaryotic-like serine/threonine-protein kinase